MFCIAVPHMEGAALQLWEYRFAFCTRPFGPTLPPSSEVDVVVHGPIFRESFFFSALIRGFVEESSICYLHVLGDLRRVGEEAQMAAWPARVFILEDLLP